MLVIHIVSSSALSHALWVPHVRSFKLSAGHFDPGPPDYDHVQDSVPMPNDVWHHVAVTFDPNVELGKMVLYKNGIQVDDANNVPTQPASGTTYIGMFYTNFYFNGEIDNVGDRGFV